MAANQVRRWPKAAAITLAKDDFEFVREPGGDRWAFEDGILDANSWIIRRRTWPKATQDSSGDLFWDGGSVASLRMSYVDNKPIASIWRHGRITRIPGDWYYHGISSDGKYLTATSESLSDGEDLFILRRGSDGRITPIRRYRKAVDDHLVPSRVDWNGKASAFLLNLMDPGNTHPFLGRSKMVSLKGRSIWGHAEWVSHRSSQILVWIMDWEGDQSFTAQSRFPVKRTLVTQLDIYDSSTGRRRTLAVGREVRAVAKFDEMEKHESGTVIEDGELHAESNRLAIVEEVGSRGRLVVKKI